MSADGRQGLPEVLLHIELVDCRQRSMLCVPVMYAAGRLFVPRLAAALLANSCLEWLTFTFDAGFAHVGYQAWPLQTRTRLWFGHGCSSNRMHSKHERYNGLGMDALVIVCSRNTNEIMVWAWML